MKKPGKQQYDDIFEAARAAKLERLRREQAAARKKWFADHCLELIATAAVVAAAIHEFLS